MANGRVFYGLLASLIAVLLVSGMAGGQEGVEYAAGEIIVTFKPGVGQAMIERLNGIHGTAQLYKSPFAGFRRLRIPPGRTVEEMVAVFSKNPNVEYAEPNYIRHAFWAPNDPLYDEQWHLDNAEYGGINMEAAWDIETGDPDVIVAVVDTGVAYEDYEEFVDNPGRGRDRSITYQLAPDLADTIFVEGYDFVNNDSHANDDNAHGTHVTGTIAQSTDNNLGVAGVAFGCSIMPVKVLDRNGSGWDTDIADGIIYAADHGANVINLSLGGPQYSETLEIAVAYAYENGVTIVCASGNDGSATTVSYPAAYDAYCIAVGATEYDEAVAYYSNGGASLDLVAPGGDVTVDQNDDGYGDGVLQQTFGSNPTDWGYWFYQGTSMAAPHVSGVAALVISHGVDTAPDDVRNRLETTAEDKGDSGWDPVHGWGIVDAYAALNYGGNQPPVADDDTATTDEDVPATVNVLANDSDPDGDLLLVASVTQGANGSVEINEDETVTYTPDANFNGLDSFSYTISDGKGGSDTATVTVTVNPVNDPPVANDDTATTEKDTPLTIDVLGNDTDPDGDGLTVVSVTEGAGSVTINADSTVTYTPVGGFSGGDFFTYVISDGNSGSATATVAVTVTEPGQNEMHVASIEMDDTERSAGRNVFTTALATVTIVDASGDVVVPGATVYGTWSGATSDVDSGITGSDGKVTLRSDEVKNASDKTFVFTVNNVTKEDWDYDASKDDGNPGQITI